MESRKTAGARALMRTLLLCSGCVVVTSCLLVTEFFYPSFLGHRLVADNVVNALIVYMGINGR